MADRLLICPLCGFEFADEDSLCRHGCPMSPICELVRCPSCDYEFPKEPPAASWLRRLFGLGKRGRCAQDAPGASTLHDLRGGDRARVVDLMSASGTRKNKLAVFGLVPGAEISIVERRPAYVVRIGETELALDPEIAREIMVETVA